MRSDRFTKILLWIAAAAVVLTLVWRASPAFVTTLLGAGGEPRTITPRGDLAADEAATIALFEGARESVVFISTRERMVDPWTQRVFEQRRGTGSGFIWDDLGHVVTNHHVVAGASRALVRLADGRVFRATLVGADPGRDLAVLRIGVGFDSPDAIPIGVSADLRVGQKVFAIGNPFGLDWTLTAGLVSALDRDLPSESGQVIRGLVQTDAAINPGNSGGPLLDSAGRLIGVNTAIVSPSGVNAGIGFAVPVDVVNRVVPQLIANGRYAPPSLGVAVDPRMDAAARRQGFSGVMVLGVTPGGAAERAGLRPARTTPEGGLIPGDAIVGLGEVEIRSVEDLRAALDGRDVGDRVTLHIIRDGERLRLEVTLDPGA